MLNRDTIALILILISLSTTTMAGYSNESEASVVVTGGNTQVKVYNAKTTNQYTYSNNTLTAGGHYMYGTTTNILSSRNWDTNAKYEKHIGKKFGAFAQIVYEGDQFAGIKSRLNNDLGTAYHYIDTEKTKGHIEAGLRYREEKSKLGVNLKQYQGRVYTVLKSKRSDDVELKLWAEYLSNFTTPSDWQITIAPSFQYNFHSNLALKWGYLGKFDNLPVPGRKQFDFQYTTALIANF